MGGGSFHRITFGKVGTAKNSPGGGIICKRSGRMTGAPHPPWAGIAILEYESEEERGLAPSAPSDVQSKAEERGLAPSAPPEMNAALFDCSTDEYPD